MVLELPNGRIWVIFRRTELGCMLASQPPAIDHLNHPPSQVQDAPMTSLNGTSELKTRFNRKYDYQRAKCEYPEIIELWFDLVRSIKAKYGIQDEDVFNFNETGFQMGIISTRVVITGSERCN